MTEKKSGNKTGFSGKLLFLILAAVSVGLFITIMVYALWMAQGIGIFADYILEENNQRVNDFVSGVLDSRFENIILETGGFDSRQVVMFVEKYPEVAEIYTFGRHNDFRNIFTRITEAEIHDQLMSAAENLRESAEVLYLKVEDKGYDSIAYKAGAINIKGETCQLLYVENSAQTVVLITDFQKLTEMLQIIFDEARENHPAMYSFCFDTSGMVIGRVKFFDLKGNQVYTLGTEKRYHIVSSQEQDWSNLGFTLVIEALTGAEGMQDFISGKSRLSVRLIGYAVIAGLALFALGLISVGLKGGRSKKV